MPMYEYVCNDCGNSAEYLLKMDSPIPPCKNCTSINQNKQLSTNTGFCLMGYGWSKAGMNSPKVGNH